MKDPVLVALLVALLGPLVTYLVAAKRFSGKVKNSDASQLWEESRSIREWSAAQIKRLEDEIQELRTENRTLYNLLELEREENRTLKAQLGDPK